MPSGAGRQNVGLQALPHDKVDVLGCLVTERIHNRPGGIEQGAVLAQPLAEHADAVAECVFGAFRIARYEAAFLQRVQQAEDQRFGHSQRFCKRRHALVGTIGKGFENGERPVHRRDLVVFWFGHRMVPPACDLDCLKLLAIFSECVLLALNAKRCFTE